MNNSDYKKIIKQKKYGKKIVLCHGVFDIVHVGHLKYFDQAKKLGDILVVSVTSDKYVNKGKNRPLFNISKRIFFLKKLKNIDFVIKSDAITSEQVIKRIKPDIYCKGPDYISKKKDINLKKEIEILKKFKGKYIALNHKKYSSSKIIDDLKKQKIDLFKN